MNELPKLTDVGDRLRYLRNLRGYTAREAVARSGVGTTTLYHWETCLSQPPPDRLETLLDAYEVTDSERTWVLKGNR